MAYRGVVEDFRKAISLQKPAKVPVVALSEEFDVRVCGGGITYNDYARDAGLMAKTQIAAAKRFGYDWAWLQVDDCIVYEVLGVKTKGEGDIPPATYGYLPPTRETLNSLPIPNPKQDGRMPVLLEAIKRIKDEFGDTLLVCGRVEGAFSAAALLYGIEETMLLPISDTDLLTDTLRYFVEIQTAFGLAQREAGADALWIGDCNASGHLMSKKYYEDYAMPYVTEMVKEFDTAGLLTLYHAGEDNVNHLALQAGTGVGALSTGYEIDVAEVEDAVGDKVCLIGNLHPINILLNGNPRSVEAETKRIMSVGKQAAGYIFNTGDAVSRDTPIENVEAMLATARENAWYE